MTSVIFAILALTLLIFIHELGHFLAAKITGTAVKKFSIGFGPAIFQRYWGDTQVRICPLLIGGSVQIAGLDFNLQEEADITGYNTPYNRQPWLTRVFIIIAGPMANYIVASLLIAAIMLTGYPLPRKDSPEIGKVDQGSVAMTGGLKAGDRIDTIDQKPVENWSDIANQVYKTKGQIIHFQVSRQGNKISLEVENRLDQAQPIGISPVMESLQLGIFGSLHYGVKRTIALNYEILRGFWRILTGRSEGATVAGPVGIVQMVSKQVQQGWRSLVILMIIISIHLGLLNLLPLPALDGGRFFFLLLNLTGLKISHVWEARIHAIGMLLLLLLVALVTLLDIWRIIG